MELDLNDIKHQLQQRWQYPYHWHQKQNNQWDNYTNFIYTTPHWATAIKLMKSAVDTYDLDKEKLFQYAANRWYNFWSARAIEQIFCSLSGVHPDKNPKNKLVDFHCRGVNFDHKTSVFPTSYPQTITYAQKHPKEFALWLYRHQSQQGRKHLGNRLFIIVYASTGQHWKLKAELFWLKSIIEDYVKQFNKQDLITLELTSPTTTYTDLIWAVS